MKKILIFLLVFIGVSFCHIVLAGSATLTWDANTEADLSGYKIYYGSSVRTGTDPKICGMCGYVSSLSVGNVTTYAVGNLTNGQTYYFSVSAVDASGNESAFSGQVSKTIVSDSEPPQISSVSASSITSSGAMITWTTNENSDSQIEYGQTASYGSQTTLNSSMITSHSQTLTGLSAGTVYNYRVKSRDASGNLQLSSNYIFTTSAASDMTPPVISGGFPGGVLAYGTTETDFSVATNEAATCRWSETAGLAYASMPNAFSTAGGISHAKHIVNLRNGQAYTLYVRCQDSAGNINIGDYTVAFSVAASSQNFTPIGSLDGADMSHVTGWAYDQNAGASPITVHIYLDGVISGSATANLSRPDIVGVGGVVEDANHGFDYAFSGLLAGTHTVRVYAINTPDGTNPELANSPKTITIADPAPVISSVSASSITSSGAMITWTTNENSDSQIEYGQTASYGSQTTLNSSMITSHSQTLTGLSAGTVYNYRVKSRDASGNLSSSENYAFTTVASQLGAPVISSGSPSGSLASGTTQTTISVLADQAAACRYSISADTVFSSMAGIMSVGSGGTYSASVSGLQDEQTYRYYIRCQSSSGTANSSDYLITFSVGSVALNYSPIGSVDGADTSHVTGWAYDQNLGSSPMTVHIYADGVILGAAIANINRSDIVGAAGGIVKEAGHGFDYSYSLASGTHTIRVYAINSPEGANYELSGSPKSITIAGSGASSGSSDSDPGNGSASGGTSGNGSSGSDSGSGGDSSSSGSGSGALPYANGTIVKSADSDRIYIIVNNQKRWISDPATFIANHLVPGSQIIVPQSELDKYATGPTLSVADYPEGCLLRGRGQIDVYIVKYNKGKMFKRLILSPSVFNNYGHLKWSDIKEVDVSVIDSFDTADLVRAAGDSRIYKLYPSGDTGRKRWVKNASVFTNLGFDWDAVYEINAFDRDSYLTGEDLE